MALTRHFRQFNCLQICMQMDWFVKSLLALLSVIFYFTHTLRMLNTSHIFLKWKSTINVMLYIIVLSVEVKWLVRQDVFIISYCKYPSLVSIFYFLQNEILLHFLFKKNYFLRIVLYNLAPTTLRIISHTRLSTVFATINLF